MNPFLKVFYLFTKVCVRASFRIFFKKTTIIGEERLDFSAPSILVANHPQTAFDPISVVVRTPHIVFFLANYSIFNTPFRNWFFRTFYCIPIKRKKEDAKMGYLDNEKSLSIAADHLSGGGCLFVAPEGRSLHKRRINPLKTGAARIALDAENDNDFKLGLTIFPFGNNYESATRFRKNFVLNVGHPIRIADFKSDFEKDEKTAANKITDLIAEQLSELIIDIQPAIDDRAFRQIEEVLTTESNQSEEAIFKKRKALSLSFLNLKENNKSTFEKLKSQALEYNKYRRGWHISDSTFKNPNLSFFRVIYLIFTFPLFIWGAVNNLIPFLIVWYLANNLKFPVVYKNTVKILSGYVIVPIFYFLQTWLVSYFMPSSWMTWVYFLTLIPAGLIAWWWKEAFEIVREKCRLSSLRSKRNEEIQNLKSYRKELLSFIERGDTLTRRSDSEV